MCTYVQYWRSQISTVHRRNPCVQVYSTESTDVNCTGVQVYGVRMYSAVHHRCTLFIGGTPLSRCTVLYSTDVHCTLKEPLCTGVKYCTAQMYTAHCRVHVYRCTVLYSIGVNCTLEKSRCTVLYIRDVNSTYEEPLCPGVLYCTAQMNTVHWRNHGVQVYSTVQRRCTLYFVGTRCTGEQCCTAHIVHFIL